MITSPFTLQISSFVCKKITTQNKTLHSKEGPTIFDVRGLEKHKSLSRQGSGHSLLEEVAEALRGPVPFPPQDFCSPCVFVYCGHNSRSCGPGSASSGASPSVQFPYATHSKCTSRDWRVPYKAAACPSYQAHGFSHSPTFQPVRRLSESGSDMAQLLPSPHVT